jgi:Bacterial archaeo-eukaryotic release factor family 2
MKTARLSDLYAEPGPFATVMLDVSHDTENGEHEHQLRVRAACEDLVEQGAPDTVVEQVRTRLERLVGQPAPVARTVVASPAGVLLDEVGHFRVDTPVARWSPLPDLARWIERQDALTPFVLAVVDHEGGDVAVYDSDVPEPSEQESVGEPSHREHKVPTGGWSALRYQHVTENVWARNAEAVADQILHRVREGYRLVLLAGDPQSLPTVRARLEDSPATVVELGTGTRARDGGDEAMQQAIREALMEHTVARRLEDVHVLKDRMGMDRAVASGVDDIADAFVRGQVDTLLLDPQAAADLTVDLGRHPGLMLDAAGTEHKLRADQALVAAAVRTSAEVRVVPSAALGGVPVVALLRWDQDRASGAASGTSA